MKIKDLEGITLLALMEANEAHERLGADGEELIKKKILTGSGGDYQETVLRIDWEAEEEIINLLNELKVPVRINSEEHGIVNLVKNPKFLAVLDGLDGTSVYKHQRGTGRYGTMFGIFSNLNPEYNDYLVSGIMEHSPKPRLFIASKNGGGFVDSETGANEPLHCSNCKELNEKTRIYADKGIDQHQKVTIINDTFISKLPQGCKTSFTGSAAVHYADLVSGAADLVLEATRKGNLEIAVAFGLLKEGGGVAYVKERGIWMPLDHKKYLECGQKEYLPTIAAATPELGKKAIKLFK